jgi:hypothetical protein
VLTGSLIAALLAAIVLRLRNWVHRRVLTAESIDADGDGIPDAYQPNAGTAADTTRVELRDEMPPRASRSRTNHRTPYVRDDRVLAGRLPDVPIQMSVEGTLTRNRRYPGRGGLYHPPGSHLATDARLPGGDDDATGA